MEMHQPSSQDSFTQLTHDLSLHLPPPLPPLEDLHPLSQDVGKGDEHGEQLEAEEEREEEEDDDDDDDFSFCCERPDGSPVSAEDVFVDGRIRPVFPLFNQSLLLSSEPKAIHPLQPAVRRIFAEDGRECPRVVEEIELPSPGSCKKSNSTGSSKLCRFVDSVVTRSSSDGKDAFVFLRKEKDEGKREKGVVGKGKGRKAVVPSDGKGKGPGTEKHKSYLPYRRDLLGFFTNSNLLSKNVHPF